MTDFSHSVQCNKKAWDASASSHLLTEGWTELLQQVQNKDFTCLDETISDVLSDLNLSGKSVVQVGCNNGREVLSLYAFGVNEATGIDQSAEFLSQAKMLAENSPHNPIFIEANAYDLPSELNGKFDLLLITIGVLNWMPDIESFFVSVSKLLKKGGHIAIYETHPFLEMLEPESTRPFELCNDYFTDKPYISQEAIVYEGSGIDTGITSYWYIHELGEIISGVINSNFHLMHFKEYCHSNRENVYDLYDNGSLKIPMSYSLVAVKR